MTGQINLFNPIFLKQKKHFSALTMAQALAVIVLGALALTFYMDRQLTALGSHVKRNADLLSGKQAQLAKINADYVIKPKSAELEAQLGKMEAQLAGLQGVAQQLQKGEFGDRLGYSAYMAAFARQVQSGLWLTGFSISANGSEVGLSGATLRPELVPALVGRLSTEPVMRGKSFATLDLHRPGADPARPAAGGSASAGAPAYLEFALRSTPARRDASAAEGK